MTDGYKLYRSCEVCWGKGTVVNNESPPSDVECPHCFGHKIKFWGWLSVDLQPMPDPELPSNPPPGSFKVKNFYVDSEEKVIVVYDDTPI